jgi:hypothetical protein
MRLMVVVVMMRSRDWKLSSDFEAELAFLGVGPQTVGVVVVIVIVAMRRMAVRTTTLEDLFFFAVFALVAVAPDVVTLQLIRLVADGEGARRPYWSVARRIGVVIVAVVFIVRESDEARALCVATENRAERWRRGAFADARAGKVKVRHCLGAFTGVG